MKITRFIGCSLNGHLNFDLDFHGQLTFVTGINGSGKTSVLNSIAALLLPRLDYLATQQYEKITIEVLNNSDGVVLSARKTDTATEITCSRFPDETFCFTEPEELESVPTHRYSEYEEEHYGNILARNATNPIVNFIESLPTPMYLGLDRRSLSLGSERIRYRPRTVTKRRPRRNIFGRSLEAGLSEALHFAREIFSGRSAT